MHNKNEFLSRIPFNDVLSINNAPLRLSLSVVIIFTIIQATVSAHANNTSVETQPASLESKSHQDKTAPETFITLPIQDYTAQTTTTYKGYATDTGGSGFNRVDIAIRDITTELWFNFTDSTFGSIADSSGKLVGISPSMLSNTNDNYTEWSLSITLPTGSYQLFALAIDNSENSQYSGKGVWPVNIPFTVK